MVDQTLKVEVRSRQGLVFEGDLFAVTSYNTEGEFDVLPSHANFVSMIGKRIVLRKANGQVDELAIDNGIMMVEDNKVRVFIGISKV
jgi:F-type H+-transporting ATPase subunit epsilon